MISCWHKILAQETQKAELSSHSNPHFTDEEVEAELANNLPKSYMFLVPTLGQAGREIQP